MKTYLYQGTITSQKFVEEFIWNKKLFYTYLIQFNEYKGYFRIVRESKHEQALIGAILVFNISDDSNQIKGYNIAGFTNKNYELQNEKY